MLERSDAEQRRERSRRVGGLGNENALHGEQRVAARGVATSPSGPPSKTWIWPSAQIARLPSVTAPGSTASYDVETEQIPPVDTEALETHGATTGSGRSVVVPGSTGADPFERSVIRT